MAWIEKISTCGDVVEIWWWDLFTGVVEVQFVRIWLWSWLFTGLWMIEVAVAEMCKRDGATVKGGGIK